MNMKKFTTLATSVFVALLVSAFAFTVVGCGGDPEAGPAGSSGSAGASAPIALTGNITQDYFDAVVSTGNEIWMVGAKLNEAKLFDFKTSTVKFFGTNDTIAGAAIVNLSKANVTFSGNGTFAGGASSTVIIATDEVLAKVGTTGTKATIVSDASGDLAETFTTAETSVIAMENYTLTTGADLPSGKKLYVLGTLTLPASVVGPSGGIAVLGTLSFGADAGLGSIAGTIGDGNIDLTNATITNTATAKLTLGTTTVAKIDTQAELTLTGTAITVANGIKAAALKTDSGATLTVTAGGLTATSVTLGTATTGALTVSAGAVDITTLTGGAAANEISFDGKTTIGTFTPGYAATIIAGTGAVQITTLGPTTTNTIKIKNTKGVTLVGKHTIADNIEAEDAVIVGSSAVGVVISSTGSNLSLAEDETVSTEKTIVAGSAATNVTLTGAILKWIGAGATYTATSAGVLTLGAGSVIEVLTGILVHGATANLVLVDADNTVTFYSGATLEVDDVAGKFGEATQADTLITVTGGEIKAAVAAGATGEWTITSDDTGTNISAKENQIALGTLAIKFDGTGGAVSETACAEAEGGTNKAAAAGKITVGDGTTVVFNGTDG